MGKASVTGIVSGNQGPSGGSSSRVEASSGVVTKKEEGKDKAKQKNHSTEANQALQGEEIEVPPGHTPCIISNSLPNLPPSGEVKPKDLSYQGPTDESK